MSAIAIITARGGSKRIPRKNIKDFCGKPIIAYSIAAAIESGCFDEVMVSTDTEEIAGIARSFGAKVPFLRSGETSGDHATTADVLLEVLRRYAQEGRTFDLTCCLYPTAPFVTADTLREAYMKLSSSSADALVPVVRFSFPPQRCFVVRDGALSYRWPEYRNARSQDLEPFYHDAGQFYLVRTKAFLAEKTVVPASCIPLVLPETKVQDIDNPEDFELAQMKYSILYGNGQKKEESLE